MPKEEPIDDDAHGQEGDDRYHHVEKHHRNRHWNTKKNHEEGRRRFHEGVNFVFQFMRLHRSIVGQLARGDKQFLMLRRYPQLAFRLSTDHQ